MNYVVLGAGLQGPAVAYALSILEPKANIWLVEKNQARLDRAKWLLKKELKADVITVKTDNNFPILESFRKRKDVTVISTLPFNMNYGIAIQCVKSGWRYYDLGGHVQTSEKIALMSMSEESTVPVMTDLGLAPGLVNILGERAIKKFKNPMILQMMCGGLPVDPFVNELNYGITFSPQGLINEYFNDCYILDNGKIRQAEPMGDLSTVVMNGTTYEAFNTSGGAHTTLESVKEKGVKFCSYKTIRYLGHSKVIRFLKFDVGMTPEQIGSLIEEKIQRINQDKVIIGIIVVNELGAKYMVDYEIRYDDNFTAMQKATGFSAAAIVAQTKDIRDKSVLTYADIDAEKLIKTIRHIKLLPDITP